MIKARLLKMVRVMVASYIRALVTLVGATQGFNVFDARGWHGVWQGAVVALVPPVLVFLGATANLLDNGGE